MGLTTTLAVRVLAVPNWEKAYSKLSTLNYGVFGIERLGGPVYHNYIAVMIKIYL